MLARTIETSIEIAAPPHRVWRTLVDFRSYPGWNPFIRSVAGPLTRGGRLTVQIKPPGRRSVTFRPVLVALETGQELRWRGRVGLPYVFDGEHAFRLEPLKPSGTRFRQTEHFSGALVPFLGNALYRATEEGFNAMNEALKQRVEKG